MLINLRVIFQMNIVYKDSYKLKTCFIVFLGILISGCMTPPINTINKTASENKVLKIETNDTPSISIPTYVDIFTYPFDPEEPQLDMGVGGRLVVIEGCLLIESSDGVFSTPILPEGVSYWDKDKGIVYIYDRGFLIGNIIRSNGVALDSQFQKVQNIFISKAKPSCLKRHSILFGTKFD